MDKSTTITTTNTNTTTTIITGDSEKHNNSSNRHHNNHQHQNAPHRTNVERHDDLESNECVPPCGRISLYGQYTIKLRHNGIETFLLASLLFNVFTLIDMAIQSPTLPTAGPAFYAYVVIFALINCLLLVGVHRLGRILNAETVSIAVSCSAFAIAFVQLSLYFVCFAQHRIRYGMVWLAAMLFLAHVSLPVNVLLNQFLTYSAIVTFFIYFMQTDEHISVVPHQMLGMFVYFFIAMALGLMSYMHTQLTHRRTFSEAKQSLEVKMVIEEQSAEQERLLLSVLPEHVAVQMRQDLGADDSEQFKKIYMSRHENVSILYADIVGFTAISSTYSAQDLVKMLNELFARFDRLAEKYHQLRIKILGDCYYCISGAPVERPDHAALCVHMGLSMVKAIKYVQQKTNSPVDMRVGIHTGAILAGILGQRQWQFDVYSKDVELANKMESSGLAGRVHISESTLGFLNGEFEVEPAFGEKREETLRTAGLKTYFIKKVLIPFKRDPEEVQIVDEQNTGIPKSDTLESIEADGSSDVSKGISTENGIPPANLLAQTNGNSMCGRQEDNDFNDRLRHELLGRDRHTELQSELHQWHRFDKGAVEDAYAKYRRPLHLLPFVAILLVTICHSIIMLVILPKNIADLKISIAALPILVYLVALVITMRDMLGFLYGNRSSWSGFINKECPNSGHMFVRGTVISVLLLVAHYWWWLKVFGFKLKLFNAFTGQQDSLESQPTDDPKYMEYQQYTFGVWDDFHAAYVLMLMICLALMTNVPYLGRMAMIGIVNVIYFAGEYIVKCRLADLQIPGVWLSVFLLSFALCLLARHNEMTDRVLFRWKTEVTEQKERASDMRRRNEALVYNILPVHVAEHFMSNKQRSYDDLYSQSYDEVGVLFASMPNFSDFYSEDTVNNQGLECLRFLNEVISDFDALLGVPRFQDVIKIKTIGSTYMAASGLNPSRQVSANDPVAVRWEHLSLLVDFALELKKALQCINEQSFNHFVLKMGINHGPITAGVIGARKPHYDIWGNTVNVASRMESTGKAGAIQVTEETCQILQTFGYTFEQRGLVAVKGKGQLMTYYLVGRTEIRPVAASSSPLETLAEVDESRDNSSVDQPESPTKNHRGDSPHKLKTLASPDNDAITSKTPLLLSQQVEEASEKEALID